MESMQDLSISNPSPPSRGKVLSILERLPNAILQQICLLSGNVNLARTNAQLLDRLNSNFLKTQLVFRVLGACEFDYNGKDLKALARNRTALLATKWCTPSFVIKCRAKYFRKSASAALARALGSDLHPDRRHATMLSLHASLDAWEASEASNPVSAGFGYPLFKPEETDAEGYGYDRHPEARRGPKGYHQDLYRHFWAWRHRISRQQAFSVRVETSSSQMDLGLHGDD